MKVRSLLQEGVFVKKIDYVDPMEKENPDDEGLKEYFDDLRRFIVDAYEEMAEEARYVHAETLSDSPEFVEFERTYEVKGALHFATEFFKIGTDKSKVHAALEILDIKPGRHMSKSQLNKVIKGFPGNKSSKIVDKIVASDNGEFESALQRRIKDNAIEFVGNDIAPEDEVVLGYFISLIRNEGYVPRLVDYAEEWFRRALPEVKEKYQKQMKSLGLLERSNDDLSRHRMTSTKTLMKRGLAPLKRTPSGKSAGPTGEDIPEYKKLDFTPPKSVQNAAKKGLKLRMRNDERKKLPKGDPDRLAPSKSLGGTEIGVARAVELSSGKPVTPRTIKRMVRYLGDHEDDKSAKGYGDESRPTPGMVAWFLWGGDAGRTWARSMLKKMEKLRGSKSITRNESTGTLKVKHLVEERIEDLIRRAEGLLAYMSVKEAVIHLVDSGVKKDKAYLAVKAAKSRM